jgi:O-glycosyl hydrolase
MRFLQFIAFLFLLIFGSCEDSFTDPNDPQFEGNTEDRGIAIHLEDTYQTIHHFGASDGWSVEIIGKNWPVEDREHIAMLLFSQELSSTGQPEGIGLSMWRTNIGAGSANQANSGFQNEAWFRETECALQADGSYDWNQQAGARWFLRKAKEYGVPYFTGWLTSPPYFMTKTGHTFMVPGNDGYNLRDDQYDDFAAYISEFIQYHAGEGLNIDYVSLVNEPQYDWQAEVGNAFQEGTPASNSEVSKVVRVVDTRFQADGVSTTQLILPESGDQSALYSFQSNYSNSSDQIRAFFNPESLSYVGNLPSVAQLVAGHSYWSNRTIDEAINHRQHLEQVQTAAGIDFWQTEYSILGGDYLEGRAENALNDIDYSLWMARIMHWDLTMANATGWSWWTALSYPKWADHKYRFGLLNWYPATENRSNSAGEIEVTKNIWAFGNFSRFIRPGYQRVEVTNGLFGNEKQEAANLMVSAYVSPDKRELVVVLINYSEQDLDVPLVNYGNEGGFDLIDDEFTAYTTSQTSNLNPTSVSVDNVRVRGKSIVTLVGQLKP